MPKTKSSQRGGLKYNMDVDDRESLARFVTITRLVLIVVVGVALALTAWRWIEHPGLEMKNTHIGLRDDNSAKCRAALGASRLADDDDNDDYCLVVEYWGDIRFWPFAFCFCLYAFLNLILTSLDFWTHLRNNDDYEKDYDPLSGLYSKYFGIGRVVHNIGHHDHDSQFWLCRIPLDFYVGFIIPQLAAGQDILYSLFGGALLGTYAYAGWVREMAHGTHTFDVNEDTVWARTLSRPWMYVPQLGIFLFYFVSYFATIWLEFVEHNDNRTVVYWSFWLPVAYYIFEKIWSGLWHVYRSRYNTAYDSTHDRRRWWAAANWLLYYLFVTVGMIVVPGWMLVNFRDGI